MSTDLEFEKARQGVKRKERPTFAVTGDGKGNLYDFSIPGNVWVRLQMSNGRLSTGRSVKGPSNLAVPLETGIPVYLGYDKDNRLYIVDVNPNGLLAANVNPLGLAASQQSSSGSQSDLSTLRVVSTNSLVVGVQAWQPIVAGTYYEFPGAQVDLTSSIPPAVGGVDQMCYATIFIKNDYLTTEVKTSTPRAVMDLPLDSGDVQECLNAASTGDTTVIAIKLVSSQTLISSSDLRNDAKFLHQIVNNGLGAAFYQTVQVNGTAEPQEPIIDFIAGTNVTLTVADDVPGTRTKLTIAATGGGGGGYSHSYLGYNTAGANDYLISTGQMLAKKITLSSDGFIMSIGAYAQTPSGNVNGLGAAVWEDSGGAPDYIRAFTPIYTSYSIFTSANYRWLHMPIAVWLTAGDWWIGIIQHSNNGSFKIAYDTGGSDRTWSSGGNVWWSDGSAYSQSNTTYKLSIRADFLG